MSLLSSTARPSPAVYCDTARIEAESADNLRLNGVSPTPLAGVPVSVKDLCDVRAELWRFAKAIETALR